MYIYGEIAGDQWGKWTDDDKCPSDFATDLAAAEGKPIDLYINSPGGSVFGGMAIYNQLRRHIGGVTAHIDGLAASISSVIMLAADRIIMPRNALVMIHDPSTLMWGYYDAKSMRELAEHLDRVAGSIMSVYSARMLEPNEDVIRKKMTAETWFNGAGLAAFFTGVQLTEEVQMVALAHGTRSFRNAPESVRAPGAPILPDKEDNDDCRLRAAENDLFLMKRKANEYE